MKCDELKPLMCANEPNVRPMYDKYEVDAAIAELKAELDAANKQCENIINSATDIMLRQDKVNDAKCDEIESLKATHYAEMVDAGMRERRLRRALWLSRAERAKTEHLSKIMYSTIYRDFIAKWVNVERKCREKAEEYK